jgi:hypothetical protein
MIRRNGRQNEYQKWREQFWWTIVSHMQKASAGQIVPSFSTYGSMTTKATRLNTLCLYVISNSGGVKDEREDLP